MIILVFLITVYSSSANKLTAASVFSDNLFSVMHAMKSLIKLVLQNSEKRDYQRR